MVPLEPYRRERVILGRRFGQHFLARKSILDGIAAAACGEHTTGTVIEIGAGRGALTAPLLERADRVVAIEVDAASSASTVLRPLRREPGFDPPACRITTRLDAR